MVGMMTFDSCRLTVSSENVRVKLSLLLEWSIYGLLAFHDDSIVFFSRSRLHESHFLL